MSNDDKQKQQEHDKWIRFWAFHIATCEHGTYMLSDKKCDCFAEEMAKKELHEVQTEQK